LGLKEEIVYSQEFQVAGLAAVGSAVPVVRWLDLTQKLEGIRVKALKSFPSVALIFGDEPQNVFSLILRIHSSSPTV
jgi:hypothetical protein